MNGMYLVTLVFQFAPGYLKVGVSVTSRYNFQSHICKKIDTNTLIKRQKDVYIDIWVKTCHWIS